MDYTLVETDRLEILSFQIRTLLAEGWKLYGSPFVVTYKDQEGMKFKYFQALTKLEFILADCSTLTQANLEEAA